MNQKNTTNYSRSSFYDCVDVVPKIKGLKKTDYKTQGQYPVVDQGQSFITAYSDKKELLQSEIPFIVFGDHTRILKYIDGPVILGNDGIKILKSKSLNLKFLYYQLLNIKIPNTGYNRHFKFLNKNEILTPPKTIQKKIADILSTVDEAIQKTDQVIQKTEKLKRGLMNDLLTRGIGHKKFKKTKLGEIPEEWEVVKLKEIASVNRGKFSHRPRNDSRFYNGNIPFIQTGDVVNSSSRIKSFTQTLNEKGLRVSRIFPKGTIVMTIAANIGDTGILEFDSCFPDSLVGIQPNPEVNTVYLEYFLSSRKPYLNSIATQSAQKNINLKKLNPLLIALPKQPEQIQIAEILSGLDRKIDVEVSRKRKLESLKKGLMCDIFNQKIQIQE